MTTKQVAEFDGQLMRRGWIYNVGDGEFRSVTQRLETEQLLSLIPGLTLGDLAAYEDHKFDLWQGTFSRFSSASWGEV